METINRLIGEVNAELTGLPPSNEVRDRLVKGGLSSEQRADLAQILMRREDLEKQGKDLEKQGKDLERQRADLEKQRADLEKQRKDLEKQRKDLEKQRADLEKQRGELISERSEFVSNFRGRFEKLDPLVEQLRLFDVESELAKELAARAARRLLPTNNSDGSSTSQGTSSYAGSTGSDTVYISKFKTSFCDGTPSKFDVRTWTLEDHTMLVLLRDKFGDSFDETLADCVSKLIKLRDMFQWLKVCMNKDIHENDVQPIFMLLLDYIIEKLHLKQSLEAFSPSPDDFLLTGVLEMKRSPEGPTESKTLRGRTDVVVCKVEQNVLPDEGGSIVNNWLFHVELKRPSSSKFNAAQSQLLCQSEVIAQMTDGDSYILGCLTDFRRIILNVRVIGGTYGRVFFVSACVATPQEYMIRLLFLFCGLPRDELFTLAQNSAAAGQVQSIGPNQEIVSGGSEVILQGDNAMSSAKRFLEGGAKYTLPKNNAMQAYFSIDTDSDDDSDDDEDEYLEQLRFNEWDARRRGVKHLCRRTLDELQERVDAPVRPGLKP